MSAATIAATSAATTSTTTSDSKTWDEHTLQECLNKTNTTVQDALNTSMYDICHQSAPASPEEVMMMLVILVVFVFGSIAVAWYKWGRK